MRIDPATADDVYWVAHHMRDQDYAEFSAVSFTESREALAANLAVRFGGHPDVLCGRSDDGQVCIGGFITTRPRVVSLLFFATDDFPRIGRGITRFIKRELFPRLQAAGVHRFEAVSLSTHHKAHAWLNVLGLKEEHAFPFENYGKNGEGYIQFARTG